MEQSFQPFDEESFLNLLNDPNALIDFDINLYLPSAEQVAHVNAVLLNYETIVKAALTYIDEDLSSLDKSYRDGLRQKYREEGKLKSLIASQQAISNKIKQSESRVTALEHEHAVIVDNHRTGFQFDKLKLKISQDRSAQKIDDLLQSRLALNNIASMLVDRINSQFSDASVHAASADTFDRANDPVVLYLRRFRYEEDRRAHASAVEILTTIETEKDTIHHLKQQFQAVTTSIDANRKNLNELISTLKKKRTDILASSNLEDERNRRQLEFSSLLKDIETARREYQSEEEKKVPTATPAQDVLSVQPEEKQKKTAVAKNRSGVKDLDIVKAAAAVYDGVMSSKDLVAFANEYFPGWQEGRNTAKVPDQALRSLRTAWYKTSEDIPGDKIKRRYIPKDAK